MERHRMELVDAEKRFFRNYRLSPHERYVMLEHLDLRLRLYEIGDGPPLLFLHGAGFTSATWAPFVRHVEGHRANLLDLPGHGLSDGLDYTNVDYRAHTVQLYKHVLDELGISKATVVGHSLGAMYALWAGLGAPERVEKIVCFGAPASALPGVRFDVGLGLMSIPAVGKLLLKMPTTPALIAKNLGEAVGGRVLQTVGEEMWRCIYHSSRRSDFAETVSTMQQETAVYREPRADRVLSDEELASLDAPTLFVWGEDDPLGGPDLAERALRHMPRAELFRTPGGHCPHLDDPEGTAQVMNDFLAG